MKKKEYDVTVLSHKTRIPDEIEKSLGIKEENYFKIEISRNKEKGEIVVTHSIHKMLYETIDWLIKGKREFPIHLEHKMPGKLTIIPIFLPVTLSEEEEEKILRIIYRDITATHVLFPEEGILP